MVRARNDGEQGKRCDLAGQSGPKSFAAAFRVGGGERRRERVREMEGKGEERMGRKGRRWEEKREGAHQNKKERARGRAKGSERESRNRKGSGGGGREGVHVLLHVCIYVHKS